MKLYETAGYPNPRRVQIFLAEKGVNIETVQINVPEGEHRQADYLAKNPYGAVPALEIGGGQVISECPAICRYVEETHPEPKLMGSTATEKAAIDMWQARMESTVIEPATTYFHHATAGLGELEPYQNKEWGQYNREVYLAGLKKLDAQLANNAFVAGESYSIADITALCGVDFAGFVGIDIPDDCPNIRKWHQTVSSRPSAQG